MDKREIELAGCLRRLLKSRFILRSRNEKWFQIIIDLRGPIQSFFDKMGIRLELNEPLGVASLVPMDQDQEELINFQLGRKRTLSALASSLLFKLRHVRLQYYLNPTSEGAPLMTTLEMREFVQNFNAWKLDSQFERAFRKALEELEELQVIFETKPDSDLYEISPICEILLPLDQIQETQAKMENYFAHVAGDTTQIENSESEAGA